MALTLEMEQRLERAGLVAYYVANKAAWQRVAQDAYDYTKKQFEGAVVRQDDLAKALRPVVEVHKGLRATLDQKKLSQKYWIDFFTSLIIDRAWTTIKKWEGHGMKNRKDAVKEAEVFVRKALSQVSDTPVDEATVKAVAKKVSKVAPPYKERDRATA
jgi:hypothetical protein